MGWEPRRNLAVRALRVAFADFSTTPWQGFEKSERGPNNSSLFQPLAAVVVAVQVLFRTEKEKPVHIVYWFFLVRIRGLEPPPSCPDSNLNLTRLPIPPYPHILFCSRAVLLGTIVIIPDMAELSSIFPKKLFPHYKTSYFREKSPLQADFPAVQRVGVSLFFSSAGSRSGGQKIRLCPTPATGTHSLPARQPA